MLPGGELCWQIINVSKNIPHSFILNLLVIITCSPHVLHLEATLATRGSLPRDATHTQKKNVQHTDLPFAYFKLIHFHNAGQTIVLRRKKTTEERRGCKSIEHFVPTG